MSTPFFTGMRAVEEISYEQLKQLLERENTTARINKALELSRDYQTECGFTIIKHLHENKFSYTKITCQLPTTQKPLLAQGKTPESIEQLLGLQDALFDEASYPFSHADISQMHEAKNTYPIVFISINSDPKIKPVGDYEKGNPENHYCNPVDMVLNEKGLLLEGTAVQIAPDKIMSVITDEHELVRKVKRENASISRKITYDPAIRKWTELENLKPFAIQVLSGK